MNNSHVCNMDIRLFAMKNGVKLYQIAKKLHIHYVTLNNKLRNELTKEKKDEIFNIIEQIKKEEK